jgi:excinuclease UvrABC helicase subunit UvrB
VDDPLSHGNDAERAQILRSMLEGSDDVAIGAFLTAYGLAMTAGMLVAAMGAEVRARFFEAMRAEYAEARQESAASARQHDD